MIPGKLLNESRPPSCKTCVKDLSEGFRKEGTGPPYPARGPRLSARAGDRRPRDASAPGQREAESSPAGRCPQPALRRYELKRAPQRPPHQGHPPNSWCRSASCSGTRQTPHLMLQCSSEARRGWKGWPSMTSSGLAAEERASPGRTASRRSPGPGKVRAPGRAGPTAPPLARVTAGGQG